MKILGYIFWPASKIPTPSKSFEMLPCLLQTFSRFFRHINSYSECGLAYTIVYRIEDFLS